ncbi:hypothetical protein [Chitinophaga sp.]|uniref:hypothetical protein n=1 Tax=Chitinophaga sp. TaxID=1869181 RepID=UPI0031D6DD12
MGRKREKYFSKLLEGYNANLFLKSCVLRDLGNFNKIFSWVGAYHARWGGHQGYKLMTYINTNILAWGSQFAKFAISLAQLFCGTRLSPTAQ